MWMDRSVMVYRLLRKRLIDLMSQIELRHVRFAQDRCRVVRGSHPNAGDGSL